MFRGYQRRAFLKATGAACGIAAVGTAHGGGTAGSDSGRSESIASGHRTSSVGVQDDDRRRRWSVSVDDTDPQVVTDGERVYVNDGSITAFDPEDGTRLWRNDDAADPYFLVELHAGTLYRVNLPTFTAIDPATGDSEWSVEVPDYSYDDWSFGGETAVFVTDGDDERLITAVDLDSGSVSWESDSFGNRIAGIADDTVVTYELLGSVYGVALSTGEESWSLGGSASSVVVGPDQFITQQATDNYAAYDLETYEERWIQPFEGDATFLRYYPAADTFVHGSRGSATAFDSTDGSERWQFEVDSETRLVPKFATDERVYLSEQYNEVYAVDRTTGSLDWSPDHTGELGVSLYEDDCYMIDEGGVAMLSRDDGSPVWRYEFDRQVGTPWDFSVVGDAVVTGAPADGAAVVSLATNLGPAADISYQPAEPTAGTAVSFESSASDPEGQTPLSHEWEFGGEGSTKGATATHAFAEPGEFDVTLTVTDATGTETAVSRTVAVQPEPTPTPTPTSTETRSPTAADVQTATTTPRDGPTDQPTESTESGTTEPRPGDGSGSTTAANGDGFGVLAAVLGLVYGVRRLVDRN